MVDIFQYVDSIPQADYVRFWDGFYFKNQDDTDALWMLWYNKTYQEWRDGLPKKIVQYLPKCTT
jgi:hypothetical protein